MGLICGPYLEYWNFTQIWNTTNPDLPLCFQETTLSWLPCIYFILILPYHLIQILHRKRQTLSRKLTENYQISIHNHHEAILAIHRQNISNTATTHTSIINRTPRNSISSDVSAESRKVLNDEIKNKKNSIISSSAIVVKNSGCLTDSFPVRQFRSSLVTGLKQTTTVCLILINFIEIFYGLFTDFSREQHIDDDGDPTATPIDGVRPPIFEGVTPGIKMCIFLLVLAIQYLHWRQRVVSSISLTLFWLLFLIQSIINTRSLIMNFTGAYQWVSSEKFSHYQDRTYVSLKLADNVLVMIEFGLSLFAEPKRSRVHTSYNGSSDDSDDEQHLYCQHPVEKHHLEDLAALPPCPLAAASVPSRLTFSWCTTMIWHTYRVPPLKFAQLWRLAPANWCVVNTKKFAQNFAIQRKKVMTPNGNTSIRYELRKKLMLSLVCTYWSELLFIATLKLINSFLPYLNSLFLSWLLQYLQSPSKNQKTNDAEPLWHSVVYVVMMLITPLAETLITTQYEFRLSLIVLRMKACLCEAIYQKSLRLSSIGKEHFTSGEMINFMALDTQRMCDFFSYFNETWSVPVQIVFAIYLLWAQMQLASLAGVAVLATLIPCNSYFASNLRALSQYVMDYKDKRLKLMHDILAGIKVLKLYAWEDSMQQQVKRHRAHELANLRRRLFFQAGVIFIYNSAPFFVTAITFVAYIFINRNNVVTPEKAFVSLSLINQLRTPFNSIPRVVAFYTMFLVSHKRLNRFMQADELYRSDDGSGTASMVVSDTTYDTIYDVKMDSCTFDWNNSGDDDDRDDEVVKNGVSQPQPQPQPPPQLPTLRDINLQVKKGSLVAVVGQVGSGKSSLLSAMLGDMHKTSGKIKINRSIAYVAQQAWIQNATLLENILFLSSHDEQRIEQLLDACALRQDLHLLSGGIHTEIGEKGVNLSGGQKQRVAIARAVYANASLYLFDDPLSALDAHVGKHIFDHIIGPTGLLCNRTRILVTHQIACLPACDYIYVMRDGQIVEHGTYQQLINGGGDGGGDEQQNGNGLFVQLLQTYMAQQQQQQDQKKCPNENDTVASDQNDDNEKDVDDDEIWFVNQCFKEIDELPLSDDMDESLMDDQQQQQSQPVTIKKKKSIKPIRVVSFQELQPHPQPQSLPQSQSSSLVLHRNDSLSSSSSTSTSSSTKTPTTTTTATSTKTGGGGNGDKSIISEERSAIGSVKMSCYMNYFHRVGYYFVVGTILMQIIALTCNVYGSQWLSRWTEKTEAANSSKITDVPQRKSQHPQPKIDEILHENIYYLSIYIVFGIGEAVFTLFAYLFIAISTLRASRILHQDMLRRILHAPMSFFESNPLGRILNRFARDIDVCDITLNMNFRMTLWTFFRTLSVLLVIGIDTWPVLIAVIPLAALYYIIQHLYMPTSRQLRRIEAIKRSPVYSHFSETLSGAPTIRAFSAQCAFVMESNRRVDLNNVANYTIAATTQWIKFYSQLLGYLVVFANALYCIMARDTIEASVAGLTLTYSMTLTRSLNQFIMVTSELENSIVCFERCLEYTQTPAEAEYRKPNTDPPEVEVGEEVQLYSSKTSQHWPTSGRIEFRNYSTRYRPGLDLVLQNVNFIIKPCERVGVVGRTGAGKSSLTLALFRIIERVHGCILVDDRDIAELGLYALRSRLTIIPQDPVLFTGDMRLNLDPFHKYTDEQLWCALEQANLRPFVESLEHQLHHPITEGGGNLSVGQRQLICLARALLRQSKILILDEATAAVDIETDQIIQRTIRQQFTTCTVFTIAHRIDTIIDYNRILVLQNGEVAEFDTPQALLHRADGSSIFRSLAMEAGLVQ